MDKTIFANKRRSGESVMKILIINDYLSFGGAEVQGIREKNILEKKGHEVYLLTFDENQPENYNFEGNGYINIPLKYHYVRRNLHKLGLAKINRSFGKRVKKCIDNISPDIVHANNLNKEPFTMYKILESYISIQTLRDYSAICPMGKGIKPDGTLCSGKNNNICIKECGITIKDKLRINLWKHIYKSRMSSIKTFISPSNELKSLGENNGYKSITCIHNSFDFALIEKLNRNVDFSQKKFLFYGVINKSKGVFELLNAYEKFEKGKNIELIFAGKIQSDIEDEFLSRIERVKSITYKGMLDYKRAISLLADIHTIIVPSVIMENYPNTVLEGLASGIFVVGSNRGGIPGMLADGRGIVFDIENEKSFINALEKAFSIKEEEYYKIIRKNQEYTKMNNSQNEYYLKIIKLFESMIRD